MKRRLVYIFFTLLTCFFFLSCKGVKQGEEPVQGFDQKIKNYDFKPYIENFNQIFEHESDSKIVFGDLNKGAPARCIYEIKVIEINAELWFSYDEKTREALTIHELAHCEFGLKHTDGGIHIMSDFIGHTVSAYIENLEKEVDYMLSNEHPKIKP